MTFFFKTNSWKTVFHILHVNPCAKKNGFSHSGVCVFCVYVYAGHTPNRLLVCTLL